MEFTDFEISVLTALAQTGSENGPIIEQLKDAKVKRRDYTGVGLFTEIIPDKNSPRLHKKRKLIEEIPKLFLEHPDLQGGAGAMLWINDGLISTLECYTFGDEWPKDESKFTIHF